jgi:hypothetical protein
LRLDSGLTSENQIEAIRNEEGVLILAQANLSGGSPTMPAIRNVKGLLFLRDVSTARYVDVIARDKEPPLRMNPVAEYTNTQVWHLWEPATQRSLRLFVNDMPEVDWSPHSGVNATKHGAVPGDGQDDSAAVNAAIAYANAVGARTVYLPSTANANWHFASPIRVWGKVRRVIAMQGVFNLISPLQEAGGPLFRIEAGEPIVVLERFLARWADRGWFTVVDHAAPNTLVLKHGRGGGYANSVTRGQAFFEDFAAFLRIKGPQSVWVRQWNAEGSVTWAINHGGTLWVLSVKTEANSLHLEQQGGATEILGQHSGYTSGDTSHLTDFVVSDGRLSVAGFHPAFQRIVEETRAGVTRVWSQPVGGRYGLFVGQ